MAKQRMTKSEMSVKFGELSDQAYKLNGKIKNRRFYPMSHNRNNKLYEFGLYDYVSKRYVLECIHSPKAADALVEVKAMLDKVRGTGS